MKRLPQVSLITEIMPPKVRELITYDVSVDIWLNSNRFSAYEANFSQFFLKESICLLSDISRVRLAMALCLKRELYYKFLFSFEIMHVNLLGWPPD